MYILAIAEGIDQMCVTAQMSHDPKLNLRVVGRNNDAVRTAWNEGLSDFLAPFCPDRDVLQVRL